MTSEFQKQLFPAQNMARMKSIVIKDYEGNTFEIDYRNLKLKILNGQLCFYIEDDFGFYWHFMPIASIIHILALIKKFAWRKKR